MTDHATEPSQRVRALRRKALWYSVLAGMALEPLTGRGWTRASQRCQEAAGDLRAQEVCERLGVPELAPAVRILARHPDWAAAYSAGGIAALRAIADREAS